MEELVKYIISSIVEDKDAVKVTLKEDGDVTIIEVSVAENDMGKVIGKNGKTASALRSIVHSASAKYNRKHILKIK